MWNLRKKKKLVYQFSDEENEVSDLTDEDSEFSDPDDPPPKPKVKQDKTVPLEPAGQLPNPANPLQIPANPLQIPANPLQIPANPLQIPANPLQIPANPLQIPANPLPIPANPLPIPKINQPQVQNVISKTEPVGQSTSSRAILPVTFGIAAVRNVAVVTPQPLTRFPKQEPRCIDDPINSKNLPNICDDSSDDDGEEKPPRAETTVIALASIMTLNEAKQICALEESKMDFMLNADLMLPNVLIDFIANMRDDGTERECVRCKFKSSEFYKLISHVLKHKVWVCRFCSRSFTELVVFKYHMQDHTAEFGYYCSQCKVSKLYKSLVNHVKFEHKTACLVPCTYEIHQHILYGYMCKKCGTVKLTRALAENHLVKEPHCTEIARINLSKLIIRKSKNVKALFKTNIKTFRMLQSSRMKERAEKRRSEAIEQQKQASILAELEREKEVKRLAALEEEEKAAALKKDVLELMDSLLNETEKATGNGERNVEIVDVHSLGDESQTETDNQSLLSGELINDVSETSDTGASADLNTNTATSDDILVEKDGSSKESVINEGGAITRETENYTQVDVSQSIEDDNNQNKTRSETESTTLEGDVLSDDTKSAANEIIGSQPMPSTASTVPDVMLQDDSSSQSVKCIESISFPSDDKRRNNNSSNFKPSSVPNALCVTNPTSLKSYTPVTSQSNQTIVLSMNQTISVQLPNTEIIPPINQNALQNSVLGAVQQFSNQSSWNNFVGTLQHQANQPNFVPPTLPQLAFTNQNLLRGPNQSLDVAQPLLNNLNFSNQQLVRQWPIQFLPQINKPYGLITPLQLQPFRTLRMQQPVPLQYITSPFGQSNVERVQTVNTGNVDLAPMPMAFVPVSPSCVTGTVPRPQSHRKATNDAWGKRPKPDLKSPNADKIDDELQKSANAKAKFPLHQILPKPANLNPSIVELEDDQRAANYSSGLELGGKTSFHEIENRSSVIPPGNIASNVNEDDASRGLDSPLVFDFEVDDSCPLNSVTSTSCEKQIDEQATISLDKVVSPRSKKHTNIASRSKSKFTKFLPKNNGRSDCRAKSASVENDGSSSDIECIDVPKKPCETISLISDDDVSSGHDSKNVPSDSDEDVQVKFPRRKRKIKVLDSSSSSEGHSSADESDHSRSANKSKKCNANELDLNHVPFVALSRIDDVPVSVHQQSPMKENEGSSKEETSLSCSTKLPSVSASNESSPLKTSGKRKCDESDSPTINSKRKSNMGLETDMPISQRGGNLPKEFSSSSNQSSLPETSTEDSTSEDSSDLDDDDLDNIVPPAVAQPPSTVMSKSSESAKLNSALRDSAFDHFDNLDHVAVSPYEKYQNTDETASDDACPSHSLAFDTYEKYRHLLPPDETADEFSIAQQPILPAQLREDELRSETSDLKSSGASDSLSFDTYEKYRSFHPSQSDPHSPGSNVASNDKAQPSETTLLSSANDELAQPQLMSTFANLGLDDGFITCPQCKKTEQFTKSSLTMHLFKHYNIRTYSCTLCDQQFMDQDCINVHAKEQHGRMFVPYRLTRCPDFINKIVCQAFTNEYPMTNSSAEKPPVEDRPTSKLPKSPAYDIEHIATKRRLKRSCHSKEVLKKYLKGVYKCSLCDTCGLKGKSVRIHLKRKHFPGFKCSTCDKLFGYKFEAEKHVRRDHQNHGKVLPNLHYNERRLMEEWFKSMNLKSEGIAKFKDEKENELKICDSDDGMPGTCRMLKETSPAQGLLDVRQNRKRPMSNEDDLNIPNHLISLSKFTRKLKLNCIVRLRKLDDELADDFKYF